MKSLAQNLPVAPAKQQFPSLKNSFFRQETCLVARALLGKGIWVVSEEGDSLLVEIVEVEAYGGANDPASHAFKGKTMRNWPMFERGGHCYVYLSYGINYCMNVSTGEQGQGEAVLFRSAAPVMGQKIFERRRPQARTPFQWLNGPGKLTQALGVTLAHNGQRLDQPGFKLVDLGREYSTKEIVITPRIGISRAQDFLWRFAIKNSPWLSRKG